MRTYKFCIVPGHLRNEGFDEGKFHGALVDLNIDWFLGYLNSTNTGHNNPYHNNAHMFGVAAICYHMAPERFEDLDVLLKAALMHDYDHTGGLREDWYNIDRATAGWPGHDIPVSIREAIDCTQFPFHLEPETDVEKILRDADLLWATLSNDPTIIMEGLRKEIEVSRKTSISYDDMVTGQIEFLTNATWYTEQGKALFNKYAEHYFNSLKDYASYKTGSKT